MVYPFLASVTTARPRADQHACRPMPLPSPWRRAPALDEIVVQPLHALGQVRALLTDNGNRHGRTSTAKTTQFHANYASAHVHSASDPYPVRCLGKMLQIIKTQS